MEKKQRIGFLFLDQLHYLNHFVTVAIALSKKHSVSILTYPDKHDYLLNTLARLNGKAVKVEMLKTKPFRAFTDKLKNRKMPRKLFWMRKNKTHLLQDFDAIVFTDYIQKPLLKFRGDNKLPKFIKFPHGVSGGAYVYKRDVLDFDLHIVFSEYYYNQLKEKQMLGNKTVIAGYPKFDALASMPSISLFKNDRPTVIYNPHFKREFTSWYAEGKKILNYFIHQEKYNLIFAPHIHLFNKTGGDTITPFIESLKNHKHIHIDLGSQACVDMVYIKMAQIYLGDVSTQSFEFMYNPRPCIFINSQDIDYKENINYRPWQCGQVISNASQLPEALNNANQLQDEKYNSIQKMMNASNFYTVPGSSASQRAGDHIINFLVN